MRSRHPVLELVAKRSAQRCEGAVLQNHFLLMGEPATMRVTDRGSVSRHVLSMPGRMAARGPSAPLRG